MLVKKLGMLLVLVLTLVTLAAPAAARLGDCSGVCSGDDCGCYIYFDECRTECAGNLSCLSACRREWIDCSKLCCAC